MKKGKAIVTVSDRRAMKLAADQELMARGFSRRQMLRTGLLLAGTAAATVPLSACTAPAKANYPGTSLDWLVGDHHVHTIFSHDAKYPVQTQLDRAESFGVDWLAFTEHSNFAHADKGLWAEGSIIDRERRKREMLIFQGLEWYIPAAEHGTVLMAPGAKSRDTIRAFELAFDGKLNEWEEPKDESEQKEWEEHARAAIAWLGEQKHSGAIDDVVVLANHPMRKGIDSPHELRAWRDADPHIMIGMEGAPGAQGGAITAIWKDGDQRGEYSNNAEPGSWPGYPEDAYRTWGGFDWITATVGGVWDSLLAEGKPFWITSNSDHHLELADTTTIGPYPDKKPYSDFSEEFDKWAVQGRRPDPVKTKDPQAGADFWPGQFSRTHTGVASNSYRGVLDAMRSGRIWVDHGHLLESFVVTATAVERRGEAATGQTTLGGTLSVPRGSKVTLDMAITTTTKENSAGILPELVHVDLIAGPITGAATDADTTRAPGTKVIRQFDTSGRQGTYTLTHTFTEIDHSFYVRFRGSDGKRQGPGYYGASIDPHGPQRHGSNKGDGDPWKDTWFYGNPIFVVITD